METLLIYIAKSSGLMAGFYLLYHFLLRRDTFFTVSRWYLLGGLLVSLSLPLLEIKKTVIVPQAQLTVEDLIALSQAQELPAVGDVAGPVAEKINWFEIGFYGYIIMTGVLFGIVLLNLISLWKLLHRQKTERRENFIMVDLDRDVAPFSFFRYIVFNSRLYSRSELESILNHEKVHSEQHHTFDVLLVRLICIIFWFNPFVWLYRKAIAQNLEYIADQEAVKRCNDRKAYQIALLKAGASSNTISITNPFFQSLIKKRIVMLNKEQSKKSNLLKYALVLPMILAFMLNFQVKLVAQEPEAPAAPKAAQHPDAAAAPEPPATPGLEPRTRIVAVNMGTQVSIDKSTTDAEMKSKAAQLKEEGVILKVSKVKRNKQREITGIRLEYTDRDGNKSVSQVKGSEPIKPLYFTAKKGSVNFSSAGGNATGDPSKDFSGIFDTVDFSGMFNDDYIEIEVPATPDAPATPDGSPAAPAPPAPPKVRIIHGKKYSISNYPTVDGKKTDVLKDNRALIVLNGKVMGNDGKILEDIDTKAIKHITVLKDPASTKRYGSAGKDGVILITTGEAIETESEALNLLKERAVKISQTAIDKATISISGSNEELAAAKAEMAKAKEEMIQAKKEMEAAKAEYEKAKHALKKP